MPTSPRGGEGKGFGPFSVTQGNDWAARLGIPADVGTAAVFSDDPGGFKRRLLAGRSQIVLWKSRPMYGHFFALVPRKGGREVEVYDSQAAGGEETLRDYLDGRRGDKRNGPPGWLGRVVSEMAAAHNVRLTYNQRAPQGRDSETCLLHTLARAAAPDVPAAQFTKKANRFFVKYAAEEAQPRTRR